VPPQEVLALEWAVEDDVNKTIAADQTGNQLFLVITELLNRAAARPF